MGGMIGLGGPSGSFGTGGGNTANVFSPPSQPQIGGQLSQGLSGLSRLATDIPGVGTGQFNPYASSALQGAQQVGQAGPGIMGLQLDYGNNLGNLGLQQLGYVPQAVAGAQQGAAIGGPVAQQAGLDASTISGGINPMLLGQMTQTAGVQPELGFLAGQAQGAGSDIFNRSLDPQSALYQQMLQRQLDQSSGAAGMSGLGSSPYAAGLTSDALKNFNINWQNNQLAREQTGLQGLLSGLEQGGALAQGIGNVGQQVGQLGGQYGLNAGRGLALGSGGAQLAAGAGALPAGAYTAPLASATGAFNNASGLDLGGLNTLLQTSTAPYNTLSGEIANAQQTLSPLQSYLQLGQNASNLSGLLGARGVDQLTQGMAGLGGLGSLFTGTQGLAGALGGNQQTGILGVLQSLFGGGGQGWGGVPELFAGAPEAAFAF